MKYPRLAFAAEPCPQRYRLRLARYQGLAEALAQFAQSAPQAGHTPLQLLDVGVGNGRTWLYCNALGVADRFAFHGIDSSPKRLAHVFGGDRWQLTQGDVQQGLPYPDGRFDTVVCEQLLEHVHGPGAVVAEMARVLRPEGLLVVGVPIFRPLAAYVRKKIVPVFDRWLGIRRDHVQAFTLRSLRHMLDAVGRLEIREARGFRILSGGPLRPLENSRRWYRFNRFLGRHLPGWCIEVQVLAVKQATAGSTCTSSHLSAETGGMAA